MLDAPSYLRELTVAEIPSLRVRRYVVATCTGAWCTLFLQGKMPNHGRMVTINWREITFPSVATVRNHITTLNVLLRPVFRATDPKTKLIQSAKLEKMFQFN